MSAVIEAAPVAERDDDEINLLEYWHVLLARRGWWPASPRGVRARAGVHAAVHADLSRVVHAADRARDAEDHGRAGAHAHRVAHGSRLLPDAVRAAAVALARAAGDPGPAAGAGAAVRRCRGRHRSRHRQAADARRRPERAPAPRARPDRARAQGAHHRAGAQLAAGAHQLRLAGSGARRARGQCRTPTPSSRATSSAASRPRRMPASSCRSDWRRSRRASRTPRRRWCSSPPTSRSSRSTTRPRSARRASARSTPRCRSRRKSRIQAEAAWRQAMVGNGLGLPQVVASPLVQKLREERAAQAAEYQQKLRTFKPDYPDMQRLAGQLAETDRQIAGEVRNIRDALRLDTRPRSRRSACSTRACRRSRAKCSTCRAAASATTSCAAKPRPTDSSTTACCSATRRSASSATSARTTFPWSIAPMHRTAAIRRAFH